MPELPEVESSRRHLVPHMEGRVIERVEVHRGRMVRRQPHAPDFVARTTGRRVVALGRRGKFLLADLGDDLTLVIHLGMSGRLQVAEVSRARSPHTHVVLGFADIEVRLVDPRTFGFVACVTPDEALTVLGGVGRDALWDLPSAAALHAGFQGRRPSVKAALLDQRVVAGLGNIYADEVLHRAGVDPRRPVGDLDVGEWEWLTAAVPVVLGDALAHGGTSLDDLAYLLPDGRAGDYLGRLAVYGRTGAPCRTCGTAVVRAVVAQRSTHWCPSCQS